MSQIVDIGAWAGRDETAAPLCEGTDADLDLMFLPIPEFPPERRRRPLPDGRAWLRLTDAHPTRTDTTP